MIAKLTGTLDSTGEDWVIVDVNGVGYLLFCSGRTLRRLPAPGAPVALAVETHVREDHIHLYGFDDPAERDWFRRLLGIQGVGAKLALAILSALSPEALIGAVLTGDKSAFASAHGVGARLATRLASELKDKVGDIVLEPPPHGAGDGDTTLADAVSALVNLGYRQGEAFGAVTQASQKHGGTASLETLIKAGLKELHA